jgi:hypothetical protein
MRLTESRRGEGPSSGAGAPRQLRPKSHRRRRRRGRWLSAPVAPVVAVCAFLAAVIGVGAYAVQVASDDSGTFSTAPNAGVSPAQTRELTRWLAANVREGTSVAVPSALLDPVREGAPRLKLQTYDDARPLRADLLVVTLPERTWSDQVRAAAASAIPMARLSGRDRVEVRQMAGSSGTAALRAEVRQRALAGAQLAQNPRLSVSEADARALRAGEVDSRLLVTLASLAAQHELTSDLVADPVSFPGVGYREARVAAVDGTSVADHPKASGPISRFIRAQPAPFTPAEARVRGGTFVLRYAVPVPLGLLDTGEIPTIGP